MTNLAELDVDQYDDSYDETTPPEPLGLAPDPVEVHRNGGLAALVGALASTVAIAYLARAAGSGAVLDWILAAVMGLLGIGHLAAFVDARTPLLVADTQGVRLRVGQAWRGLPWGALRAVEVAPQRGPLRDGRLVLVLRNPGRLIEELDRRGRRQSWLSRRLYGAPFAVPLALSTRVTGASGDLTAALARLAGDGVPVVDLSVVETDVMAAEVDVDSPVARVEEVEEVEVEDAPVRRDPRPWLAHVITLVSARLQRSPRPEAEDVHGPDEELDDDGPLVASATPSPLRDPVSASRAEVHRSLDEAADEPEGGRELRRPGSVSLVEDTVVWGERVSPIAKAGPAVEPLRIDEFAVEPAEDPVVGPELAAARTRLGLTVDQLAERTRIRPHVIESIEVDDFAPCGGDFYARGHLRTLARVLGIDVAPLLTRYDERYADAPVDARRVFEAELGAGGSIRSTRGGPNWSVLIAAVMTLVLAWSIARLVMDSPVELRGTPVLNGSGGISGSNGAAAPAVPVEITAAGGGAHVVVRDSQARIVFNGNLAFGESRVLDVSPPVRITSSDGSLEVVVDGQERGPMGTIGQTAQNTFTAE